MMASYSARIQSLLDDLVNPERDSLQRLQGMRLNRMQRLLTALGRPDERLNAVHVLGSKGKGSTACFLAHLMAFSFGEVGLYSSPHLYDVRERIQVIEMKNGRGAHPVSRGRMISLRELCAALEIVMDAARRRRLRPTYFEALTAAAAVWFQRRKLRWMVVEAGLGGRWDATTAFANRPVAVVTPIGHEHEDILGAGLKRIAAEKAAAIRAATKTVVSAGQRPAVARVLRQRAERQHAEFLTKGKDWDVRFPSGDQGGWAVLTPRGNHGFGGGYGCSIEAENFGLALAAADHISGACLDSAWVKSVWSRVRLPCRRELVLTEPPVMIDGAHTPESMNVLVEDLTVCFPRTRWLILFGCLTDKPAGRLIRALQRITARLIIVTGFHERAVTAVPRIQYGCSGGGAVHPWKAALMKALRRRERGQAVLITGSLYWAALARPYFLKLKTHRNP